MPPRKKTTAGSKRKAEAPLDSAAAPPPAKKGPAVDEPVPLPPSLPQRPTPYAPPASQNWGSEHETEDKALDIVNADEEDADVPSLLDSKPVPAPLSPKSPSSSSTTPSYSPQSPSCAPTSPSYNPEPPTDAPPPLSHTSESPSNATTVECKMCGEEHDTRDLGDTAFEIPGTKDVACMNGICSSIATKECLDCAEGGKDIKACAESIARVDHERTLSRETNPLIFRYHCEGCWKNVAKCTDCSLPLVFRELWELAEGRCVGCAKKRERPCAGCSKRIVDPKQTYRGQVVCRPCINVLLGVCLVCGHDPNSVVRHHTKDGTGLLQTCGKHKLASRNAKHITGICKTCKTWKFGGTQQCIGCRATSEGTRCAGPCRCCVPAPSPSGSASAPAAKST